MKRGSFTLKSGKSTDWFIDAKATTCRPDGMLLVADAALAELPDDITAIGGLTMGGECPLRRQRTVPELPDLARSVVVGNVSVT